MESARPGGRFVTLEGIDGVGKSTQLECASRFLKRRGIAHVVTREPGGTRLGEAVRALLLDERELDVAPMSQLLLVFAARAQHLEEVVRPALDAGRWVVCDRFTDATYAYQGEGAGVGFDAVARVERLVQGALRPDLTILLDAPVEVGLRRTEGRAPFSDRFESLDFSGKQRIREAYLRLHELDPERIRLVDASLSIARVGAAVEDALRGFIESSDPDPRARGTGDGARRRCGP